MGNKISLLTGERIDDLQRDGLQIIQNPETFCFGMDAVLLSGFAKAFAGEKVVDLCCGCGVIPLLMSSRFPNSRFYGLEIQAPIADMARRSVELNGREEQIHIVTGDLCNKEDLLKLTKGGYPQVVTVNPPYMQIPEGKVNRTEAFSLARHEIACDLESVLASSARLLQSKGRFYMVHRPSRLTQILESMHRFRIEPKRMQLVHPREGAEANIVLVEGVKDASPMMRILPPLFIYGPDGQYTREVRQIYEGNSHEDSCPKYL